MPRWLCALAAGAQTPEKIPVNFKTNLDFVALTYRITQQSWHRASLARMHFLERMTMRTHTHRALAAALTAGVAVALLPAGAAIAQPVQNNDDARAATAARPAPGLAEAEKKVAAAQEKIGRAHV